MLIALPSKRKLKKGVAFCFFYPYFLPTGRVGGSFTSLHLCTCTDVKTSGIMYKKSFDHMSFFYKSDSDGAILTWPQNINNMPS